jgi:hypothetical protein
VCNRSIVFCPTIESRSPWYAWLPLPLLIVGLLGGLVDVIVGNDRQRCHDLVHDGDGLVDRLIGNDLAGPRRLRYRIKVTDVLTVPGIVRKERTLGTILPTAGGHS